MRMMWLCCAAVMLYLAGPAWACSPPVGDVPKLTKPQRAHHADTILVGKIVDTFVDDEFNYGGTSEVYTAVMKVYCIYKGDVSSSMVNITHVGPIPGMCHTTQLNVGAEYVVYLSGEHHRITDVQIENTPEHRTEVSQACGLTLTYPDGISPDDLPHGCPVPASVTDCVPQYVHEETGPPSPPGGAPPAPEGHAEHEHQGHDLEGHEGHGHEDHDHDEYDHKGHDHVGHSHEEHDGHDSHHAAEHEGDHDHDHEGHDHDDHGHDIHDSDDHDHDSHDHGGHDHEGHDHDEFGHEGHDHVGHTHEEHDHHDEHHEDEHQHTEGKTEASSNRNDSTSVRSSHTAAGVLLVVAVGLLL